MEVKVVIPSKNRVDTIATNTLALIPNALVCVEESEIEAYSRVVPHDQLLPHPPLKGLPSIRNWIVANVPDQAIFMVDDDIIGIMCMTGRVYQMYKKPEIVMQIIENCAEVANEIGAPLFGFSQSARPHAFRPFDPFTFNKWIGTAIGVIGKDVQWDSSFKLRGDVDASLRVLLHNRITFADERFHFLSSQRMKNLGGSTAFRSSEQDNLEIARLRTRWGRFISFGTVAAVANAKNGKAKRTTTFSPSIHVSRRQ